MSEIEIPGYGLVDIEKLPQVKILDVMGILRGDYLLVDTRPDRRGLLTVLDQEDNKILKVHPKRVECCDKDGCMAVQIVQDGRPITIAACPECSATCDVNGDVGVCHQHGQFIIIGKIFHKTPKVESQIKQPVKTTCETVDLLSKCDELWVDDEVKFDDGKTDVKAFSMRVNNKYISFNLYNGSFGRKGNIPPFDALRSGETGYEIKNIEKWRKKLRSKGYKQVIE